MADNSVGPALNPTTMTGYAGTSAARKQAERRANIAPRPRDGEARRQQADRICTRLDWYARQPKATPAKMRSLHSMCRQLGYPA